MSVRVVVTGIGVVTSIGIGKDDFWSALVAGKSGITKIDSFDTSGYRTHNAGEIKDFCPRNFISEERLLYLGRASCLAIAAAKLSLDDSGANLEYIKKEKAGVVLGTTMGESQVLEQLNDAWIKNGHDAIDPNWVINYPAHVLSANIGIEFGITGYNCVLPTACASGNYAIGYAYDLISNGRTNVMFAGGTDAFSRVAFTGFNRLLAVAADKCQPFDKNRKGMMVGEGAAVLILESMEKALARNADIYAEILGYGLSCDAYDMTAPFSDGIKEAVEKAIKESGINKNDVDYFSAHGTGTMANDKEECLAIKKVFGERAKKIPVSSIKSMLGHTMGAASAIEAAACCLSVKNDLIPPTINFDTPDPECDIDCVPNTCRNHKVNIALNHASAFGGNNACLVLKKFKIRDGL